MSKNLSLSLFRVACAPFVGLALGGLVLPACGESTPERIRTQSSAEVEDYDDASSGGGGSGESEAGGASDSGGGNNGVCCGTPTYDSIQCGGGITYYCQALNGDCSSTGPCGAYMAANNNCVCPPPPPPCPGVGLCAGQSCGTPQVTACTCCQPDPNNPGGYLWSTCMSCALTCCY
jgi:hypothetical protein